MEKNFEKTSLTISENNYFSFFDLENLEKFLNNEIIFYDFYVILFSLLFFVVSFITLFFISKSFYRTIYVLMSVVIVFLLILFSSNILGKPLYIEYYHNILNNKSDEFEILYVYTINEKSGDKDQKRGYFLLKNKENNKEPLYFTMIINEEVEKKLKEAMKGSERDARKGKEKSEKVKLKINRKSFRSYEIEIFNEEITPKKLPDKVLNELEGSNNSYMNNNNDQQSNNDYSTFLENYNYGSNNFP